MPGQMPAPTRWAYAFDDQTHAPGWEVGPDADGDPSGTKRRPADQIHAGMIKNKPDGHGPGGPTAGAQVRLRRPRALQPDQQGGHDASGRADRVGPCGTRA